MPRPIENAFPANRRPGRGNVVEFTDHGKAAGKQRFGITMKSAAGKTFFTSYPERFSTPGGVRTNLKAVLKCIEELFAGKANVVHVQGKPPRPKAAKKVAPVAPVAAPVAPSGV